MNIVVATDGSNVAMHALRAAFRFAAELRHVPEIHVVAVVDYLMPPAGLSRTPPDAPDLLAADAAAALAAAEEHARREGVVVESHLLRGHADSTVLDFARECLADLIVVGTHGRKGLARAVLGSVCERILRESDIPVLAVRGPA